MYEVIANDVIAKVHLFGTACHRDFDPPETLVRRTNIPRDFGLGDHLLRIGDNGLVQILGWFSGSKSEGMHFSYLGGTVWLRNAR